jgi:hypothetical protein
VMTSPQRRRCAFDRLFFVAEGHEPVLRKKPEIGCSNFDLDAASVRINMDSFIVFRFLINKGSEVLFLDQWTNTAKKLTGCSLGFFRQSELRFFSTCGQC